ncbi:MAG: substrate-binding domain-containing protein [Clostridia bacterium]|nr:substrate-binding domain-containing protein [Clostridia bacterium]
MRRFYILIIIVISLIFVSAFVFSNVYFQNSSAILASDNKGILDKARKPEYHFVFIAQNTDDPFWQTVNRGAMEAAKELNVAVEFNGPRFTNITEELQYLDIAIASKVDGIATHVLDEALFEPYINKAVQNKIPVVTVENDVKNSARSSFIGTNSYMLGTEGGKLLAEATGGRAKVAVILNNYNNSEESITTTQNLRIKGFRDAVKNYPEIEIKTIHVSKQGIFSAEEVTTNILNQFPDVNAILCTTSKDTIGAAQVIVDFNKVGDISIIGYDDMPDILRYVEKGVVYGTVTSNPLNIGYETVKALVDIKRKQGASAYIDAGVHVINRKNVKDYMNNMQKMVDQEGK